MREYFSPCHSTQFKLHRGRLIWNFHCARGNYQEYQWRRCFQSRALQPRPKTPITRQIKHQIPGTFHVLCSCFANILTDVCRQCDPIASCTPRALTSEHPMSAASSMGVKHSERCVPTSLRTLGYVIHPARFCVDIAWPGTRSQTYFIATQELSILQKFPLLPSRRPSQRALPIDRDS